MREYKNIFDFLSEVLIIFSITILMFLCIVPLFGEQAKEISTMFDYGGGAIAIHTLVELLGMSFIEIGIKYIYSNERIVASISGIPRLLIMFSMNIGSVVVFAYLFQWFPFNAWLPWVGFGISFTLCVVLSIGVMNVKTKLDTKKLEEGLKKFKEKGEDTHE